MSTLMAHMFHHLQRKSHTTMAQVSYSLMLTMPLFSLSLASHLNFGLQHLKLNFQLCLSPSHYSQQDQVATSLLILSHSCKASVKSASTPKLLGITNALSTSYGFSLGRLYMPR